MFHSTSWRSSDDCKPNAGVKEILRSTLARCCAEGLFTEDGLIDCETVFRRFTADVFRIHRQDARLREFQALLERCQLVTELVQPERKQCRVDLNRLRDEMGQMSHGSTAASKQETVKSANEAKNINALISSIQSCSLIRDEFHLDTAIIYAKINHVTTVSRPIDHRFSMDLKSCPICRLGFRSTVAFLDHMKAHGPALMIQESIVQPRTRSPLQVKLRYDQCQLMSTIEMRNVEINSVTIDCVYLYHIRFELLRVNSQLTILEYNRRQGFLVQNSLLSKSPHKYSLLIFFHRPGEQQEYLEQHHLQIFEIRQPNKNGRHFTSKRGHRNATGAIKLAYLQDYFTSKELNALVANNFQLSSPYTAEEKKVYDSVWYLCTTDPKERLNASNYTEMLETMVHVHDLNVQLDLAKYKVDDVLIVPAKKLHNYQIKTSYFEAVPTNLAEGDIITIATESSTGTCADVRGCITQILYDHVVVELEEKIDVNCRCRLRLHANRTVCRIELQALDIVRHQELSSLFFPSALPKDTRTGATLLSWYNTGIAGNPEQQTAVKNIVNRSSFPLPYILFGPPGTGKTTTIIEAIVQICIRHPNIHILVTAQSNAACDDLTLRLMKFLSPNRLYRFFSRSTEKRIDDVPDALKQCSNFCDGTYKWPLWDDVYGARVFICTLTVCGRLVQAGIRTRHFEYVFIDESGSATEPATLVALAGLVSCKKKLLANVILAGDPYQLGPVIRSELAAKMGLGMSMLERLMNLPVYQKDSNTNQYNPQVLTKLTRNYRSHKALISFSNVQFYDNELIAVAPEQVSAIAENWKWLPNKKFPIILHTVFGSNEQKPGNTSRMNYQEIETVEFYLDFILKAGIHDRKISQEEIGIISPYQLQVERLREMCLRKGWPSVEIGSVEQYQGREKLVIILSTVRSHTPDVGFLNDMKRLNVALTRAKALLIVVGNSNTLQKDAKWYEFIKYCKTHGAIVGSCFELRPSGIVESCNRDKIFDTLFNVLV